MALVYRLGYRLHRGALWPRNSRRNEVLKTTIEIDGRTYELVEKKNKTPEQEIREEYTALALMIIKRAQAGDYTPDMLRAIKEFAQAIGAIPN
jgi:hypothetical protein